MTQKKAKPNITTNGQLVVGATDRGMVYLTIPIKTPGDIVFSVEQAKILASEIMRHAERAAEIRAGERGAYPCLRKSAQ